MKLTDEQKSQSCVVAATLAPVVKELVTIFGMEAIIGGLTIWQGGFMCQLAGKMPKNSTDITEAVIAYSHKLVQESEEISPFPTPGDN